MVNPQALKQYPNNKMKIIYEQPTKERLDKFLTAELGLSRSKVQAMIKAGEVMVNGKLPAIHEFLKNGSVVEFAKLKKAKTASKDKVPANSEVQFKVIEETKNYLIVEKPAGVIVHPTDKAETDTLANGLVAKYPELKKVGENELRPGVVHRIDKEASGLLIIPRNQKAFEYFKNLLKTRQVTKIYTVLIHGDIDRDEGSIDFKIGRSRKQGRMAAYPNDSEGNRDALTHFEVVDRFEFLTLLKVTIATGRTHQIRVHMNALNYPVVGDKLYTQKFLKRKNIVLDRLFLHASELAFVDMDGEKVHYKCPLPKELKDLLKTVKIK